MPRLPIRYAVLLALALPGGFAQAETLDQLDALSDATADEAGGIALARFQAQAGQYLDALSTLERVLGTFPTSREALLEHAVTLCLIDDLQGGRVELQLLRERDYNARQLSDARAVCSGTVTVPVRTATQPPPPPVRIMTQPPPPPPPPPARTMTQPPPPEPVRAAPSNGANSSAASSGSSDTKPKVD